MTDANYDDQLNEPDPRYCEDHNQPVPCLACRADASDRAYDSQRDRKDDHV
jgi:hypothetical protein